MINEKVSQSQCTSYIVEVIADNSGTWCGNQLTFASHRDAEAYAIDLARRWTSVRDYRVVEVVSP